MMTRVVVNHPSVIPHLADYLPVLYPTLGAQ
jgi:hypothetical protein